MTFTPDVLIIILLLVIAGGVWKLVIVVGDLLEQFKFHPPKEELKQEVLQETRKKANYMGSDGLYSYDNVDLKALQQRIKDIEEGR